MTRTYETTHDIEFCFSRLTTLLYNHHTFGYEYDIHTLRSDLIEVMVAVRTLAQHEIERSIEPQVERKHKQTKGKPRDTKK